MSRRRDPSDFIVTPFAIVFDNNEQIPYTFQGLRGDSKDRNRPIITKLIKRSLETADYTIDGWESRVCVERKSLSDFFSTLSQGRERFENELVRMDQCEASAVVVEGSWDQIFYDPPSGMLPKSVHRSIIAWTFRYPRVSWWMMGSRRAAEITTFRFLERFYSERANQIGV